MHGLLIKTVEGDARRNPLVKVAADAANDMMRHASQFGFTPASRNRISITDTTALEANLDRSCAVKRTREGRQRAKAVIDFIENLTVPSGHGLGERFRLARWQKTFIRDIYEPQRNGKRVVRRAVLSIARRNGKTPLIAAIALAHLVGPEPILNGEILSAANDREQAALVFKYARQITELEPELAAQIETIPSTKATLSRRSRSVYRAISAEAATDGAGSARIRSFFWKPEDTLLEHSYRDFGSGDQRYVQWASERDLFTSPGRAIDPYVVAMFIARAQSALQHSRSRLRSVALRRAIA